MADFDPTHTDPGEEMPLPTVACWRCGLMAAAADEYCPHCGAGLVRSSAKAGRRAKHDESRPLKIALWSYAALLTTGIIHGGVLSARFGDVEDVTPRISREALYQIAVVEAIDTIIVVAAFIALAAGEPMAPLTETRRISAWFAAVPLLAGMLAINFMYHEFLRQVLRLPLIQDDVLQQRGWLTFVVVCIQPAIVEEVYCRGFAMGLLRRVTGSHAAVWIAAAMFAMMHVAVLLSIPYLFLVGLLLGYLRLASGTIWLPIIVHFLHNLAVLLREWN